jgi:hypothetical protein
MIPEADRSVHNNPLLVLHPVYTLQSLSAAQGLTESYNPNI